MENAPNLDWLLGSLAVMILLGGLFMLASGVSGMGADNGKPPKQ